MSVDYTREHPLGRWSEDGAHFEFDLDKVANETGHATRDVRTLGILYCIAHPLKRGASAVEPPNPRPTYR